MWIQVTVSVPRLWLSNKWLVRGHRTPHAVPPRLPPTRAVHGPQPGRCCGAWEWESPTLKPVRPPLQQNAPSAAHHPPCCPAKRCSRDSSAATPSLGGGEGTQHLPRAPIGCCLLLTHVTGAGAPRPSAPRPRGLPLSPRAPADVRCRASSGPRSPPRPLCEHSTRRPERPAALQPTPTRWQCSAVCPHSPAGVCRAGRPVPAQPCPAKVFMHANAPRPRALQGSPGLGRFALPVFSSSVTQRMSFGGL